MCQKLEAAGQAVDLQKVGEGTKLLLTMADRNSDDEVYSDGSCRVHVEQRREVREVMWRLHLEHLIKALGVALKTRGGRSHDGRRVICSVQRNMSCAALQSSWQRIEPRIVGLCVGRDGGNQGDKGYAFCISSSAT